MSVRARLDADASCSRDGVLEPGGGRLVVGVRFKARSLRFPRAPDLGFEGSDRPGVPGGSAGKPATAAVVGLGQQCLAVAFGQHAVVDEIEGLVREFEQANGVREVGPASAKALGQFGDRDLEVVEKERDCSGLLDRG